MTATTLASYAITGRREIWPLFVVLGLLLVVVTGFLVAQFTDPDRRNRSEGRRALVAGIPADGAPNPSAEENEPAASTPSPGLESADHPDVDLPQQGRRAD